jgi:hypothetical protein
MRRGGRLIVCEATGTWGIGLRRALQNVSWRIIETRSARDCFWQLAQHPVSIVAWEGAIERADALVGHLLHQNRFFPRCSAVVLCDRAAARFDSLWREAGAIHVVHSPRELDRIKTGCTPSHSPDRSSRITGRKHLERASLEPIRQLAIASFNPPDIDSRTVQGITDSVSPLQTESILNMSTASLTPADIEQAFADFPDPETGRPALKMNQIRDIQV